MIFFAIHRFPTQALLNSNNPFFLLLVLILFCFQYLKIMANTIKIDVISDFACPWCYVGKARMEAAVSQFQSQSPDVSFVIQWHPYMIDLGTQPVGEEYLAYNRRRWGGDGWTRSLKRAGAQDGLRFASWVTWPNTFNAHRLMQIVQDKAERGEVGMEKQGEVKDSIFKCIYEEGGNASNVEDLVRIAEGCGLDAQEVRAFLESEELKSEVAQKDRYAKQDLDVSGVPFFIIQKHQESDKKPTVLNGAAECEQFLSAFSRYV